MLQSLAIGAFSERYDFQHFVAINRKSMNFLKKSRKKAGRGQGSNKKVRKCRTTCRPEYSDGMENGTHITSFYIKHI